ncbi:MAG: DUF488 domain-containing protein [Candidatus Marsarchaeota archaeon]|nr:DUF488 domain-containing protein [Candidatus Marsarchaeota archaeon]
MVIRVRGDIYSWRDSKDKLPNEIGLSVMSRHTDNLGKNPDPNIFPDSFTMHIPELGPPPWLINWWYRGNELPGAEIAERQETFKKDYLNYLRTEKPLSLARKVASDAVDGHIALLCKEKFPQFCHRYVLALFLRGLEPMLVIDPPIESFL